MKNNYDIVLVGGGIANIALALKLIDTDYNVAIFERGHGIYQRQCPKSKTGVCVDCKPSCQITTGFAGAGCFSDTKLTYSSKVGGSLIEYIGKEKINDLLGEVDILFKENGATADFVYDEEFVNKFQYECSKHSLQLIKSPVKHLGTDGSYEIMKTIWNKLNAAPNIDVFCDSDVTYVNFDENYIMVVLPTKEKSAFDVPTQINYKYLSIAVGRYGASWLRDTCIYNGIKLENTSVDIGVRIECPRAVLDPVTDGLYEFKIVNYSSSGNKVRTFCVNPGGYVVQENYGTGSEQIKCVNGHSFSDNKSMNSNFALLVSCNFKDPFNEPIKYARRICQLANMLADGKPMVQRLADLKVHKRSNKTRMERLSITPTLENAEPGDLRYVLPANIIDSIIETLDNLNNVIPGISGNDTILYAPEVKFYSSKIELNNKLQNDKFDNVFFIGDSSGVTHGIIQSAMSGIYVANQLLEENTNED